MRPAVDLTGNRFGRLTALYRAENRNHRVYWRFLCDCGVEKDIYLTTVRKGKAKSCGCLSIELCRRRSLKHGHTVNKDSPEYTAWIKAKARCFDIKSKDYKQYGARGISMYDGWKNDFQAFLSHMGQKPIGTSLDRIDYAGNYEPGNCRWATPKEQSNNTKRNIYINIEDEKIAFSLYAERIEVDYKPLYYLHRAKKLPLEEAVRILKNR